MFSTSKMEEYDITVLKLYNSLYQNRNMLREIIHDSEIQKYQTDLKEMYSSSPDKSPENYKVILEKICEKIDQINNFDKY